MKIQIDLPENINHRVKVYKEIYKFKTLQEAVNNIIYNAFLQEDLIMAKIELEKTLKK